MRYHRPALASLALSFAACAAAQHPAATVGPGAAPTVVQMEPMKVVAQPSPTGPKIEIYDAGELFERAGADLQASRWKEATDGYDRLVAQFPTSRYVVAALYNAGLSLEGVKDFAGAAARYRRIADEHGDTRDALDALFRMGGCYAEIENWPASADAFARLLEHKELSVGDRVEASARRGLAQYQMKDGPAAERTFRDALAWYRQNESVERLESDFFVAMCQFYLGEVSHDLFRALPLRLPEKQLRDDLEAKAQLLLSTQALYVETARVRNPAWATAAGYQMATLYKEMYDAILAAPVPPELNDEARQIYSDELKKTIAPLLRKAIHAHELTQGVAERNGIDNDWVRKSTVQMEQLRALLDPNHVAPAAEIEGPGPAPALPKPPTDRTTDGRGDKLDRPPQPPSEKEQYTPRVIL